MSTDTADRILAAARQLLNEQGMEAVAMRNIAQHVGITPMAIYRHYKDRAALLNAIAAEGFRDLSSQLRSEPLRGGVESKISQLGTLFVDFALARPNLYRLMFLARREGARVYPADFQAGRSPTFEPTVKILQEAMTTGELRADNAVEIAFEISAISHGLIVLYLGGRIGLGESEFRKLYKRSFRRYFDGLRR